MISASRKSVFAEDTYPSLRCANKTLSLHLPRVMGILNVTPDSFADGGRYLKLDTALKRVALMIDEGADIIDIGAESTAPYSQRVCLQEEIDRILPIVTAVQSRFDTILSVDTYKSAVMHEVIKAGVHLINDIHALQGDGSLEVVSKSNVGVCLMHMQGTPETMQNHPSYTDVTIEVGEFLQKRVQSCLAVGIQKDRMLIDPGFGFGKTTEHNMQLLKNLRQLQRFQIPILAGLSRKFSMGEILSLPVEKRLFGSIAAHVLAITNGAAIVRTHDVEPTVQALKITHAVLRQESLE